MNPSGGIRSSREACPAQPAPGADAPDGEGKTAPSPPPHPPRPRKDGAVSFYRCSAVDIRRPSVIGAERAARHHVFHETGNQPLAEKGVVALITIARDAL